MRRSLQLLLHWLAASVAVAAVLVGLLAARISAGPLSLGILAPALERAIENTWAIELEVGDIVLDWQQWAPGPELSFADIAVRSDDGQVNAHIREAGASLSPQAMASGHIALATLHIDGGEVTLTRTPGGDWNAPVSSSSDGGDLASLLDDLGGPPHADGALGYLNRAAISDLDIHLREATGDARGSLRIDQAELVRGNRGLAGSLAVDIAQTGAESASLTLTIAPAEPGGLAATLTAARLRPALLTALPGAPAELALLDLPLDGSVSVEGDGRGGVRSASLDLRGGPGRLVLDRGIAARLGAAEAAQELATRSLVVQGSYRGADARFDLTGLQIAFAPGTLVFVPAPVDHRFPITALSGSGRLSGDQLQLTQLQLDLQGPLLTASGNFAGMPEKPSGRLEIVGTGIRVEHFRRYWPPRLASGGYTWCTEHLADGLVPELRMQVDVAQGKAGTVLANVRGTFGVEQLSVDYLPPMPPIRNARGSARFDENVLDITVTDAQAAGLRVRSGRVLFPDLNRDVPEIRIDARIEGPLRSALAVLASPPLEYPQKLGIEPAHAGGQAVVDLHLGFPLLNDLQVAQLDVAVAAEFVNAALDLRGIALRQGNGRLEVTPEQMRIDARLSVGPALGELEWVESFLDHADPRSRVRFRAEQVDIPRLRAELADPRLEALLRGGSFAGTIQATLADGGRGEIGGQLDVTRSSLALPPLGWNKEAGVPGSVEFDVRLDGGRLSAVPRLVMLARDLDLRGALSVGRDGGLESLAVESLTTGRTDMAATLTRLADGSWDAVIDGRSLDLAPLLAESQSDAATSGRDGSGAMPDFTLAADIDTVWFGADAPISRAMATVVHKDQVWSPVQVQGTLLDGSMVDLAVFPEDASTRTLTMTASNAGGALRAFDIFPDMVGGDLAVHGRFDDRDPAHPLSGRLRARNFYIVKMPLLARLLSVLALTGILDALSGRGIAFSHLDLPFEVSDGTVRISNGRAYGSALGITASGSIDRAAESIAISGELVPFYAINSALGRLPLLGEVMTGGEKGGGVFSASYSVAGPLSDPAVRVNPVTVLLPGFLRYLLETFQDWADPDDSSAGAGQAQ